MQRLQPIGTGDIREPVAIFFRWMLEFLHSHTNVVFQPPYNSPWYSGINPYALGFAMFQDGVDPAVPRAVVGRLEHHVGVAVQKLQHKALCHFSFVGEERAAA
jgi:hypothetical protein